MNSKFFTSSTSHTIQLCTLLYAVDWWYENHTSTRQWSVHAILLDCSWSNYIILPHRREREKEKMSRKRVSSSVVLVIDRILRNGCRYTVKWFRNHTPHSWWDARMVHTYILHIHVWRVRKKERGDFTRVTTALDPMFYTMIKLGYLRLNSGTEVNLFRSKVSRIPFEKGRRWPDLTDSQTTIISLDPRHALNNVMWWCYLNEPRWQTFCVLYRDRGSRWVAELMLTMLSLHISKLRGTYYLQSRNFSRSIFTPCQFK